MGFNALRFKALKKHFQGSCTCALFTMSDGNSVVKRLKVPPPSPKNIRPGTVGSVCRPSTNLLAAPSQRASFAETGRLWAPHHAAAALPIWPPVPSERGFKCPFLCLHATAVVALLSPPSSTIHGSMPPLNRRCNSCPAWIGPRDMGLWTARDPHPRLASCEQRAGGNVHGPCANWQGSEAPSLLRGIKIPGGRGFSLG